MINSVNGKEKCMKEIFPLAKKYGGVVVCLCLDEDGIPSTAEGRITIAEKIINTAKEYGIDKKDLVVDALTMTISTDKNNSVETLKAVDYIRHTLGVNTVLGVSNISFGLPNQRGNQHGVLHSGYERRFIGRHHQPKTKVDDERILQLQGTCGA